MDKKLFDALQVRFIKLRFTLVFPEDSTLPRDKVSAIRGGMGEMLLRMNCVRDRQCESCDFETECIVQRILYSKFEKKPDFVTTGGSVGYVLECEDYRENIKAGEKLEFNLILFGKTIVYFSQLYQSLSLLGELDGIGKYHARFHISEVRNMEGMALVKNNMVDMNAYVIHRLYDYLLFRKVQLGDSAEKRDAILVFDTPLTLKYQNKFMQEFQMEPIISAIKRRIYMLNCFEETECNIFYQDENSSVPRINSQKHHLTGVSRYSTRKNEKMILRGIKGYAMLEGLTEEILTLLLIGELIHIGKNTSFGFGRYHLKFVDSGE